MRELSEIIYTCDLDTERLEYKVKEIHMTRLFTFVKLDCYICLYLILLCDNTNRNKW